MKTESREDTQRKTAIQFVRDNSTIPSTQFGGVLIAMKEYLDQELSLTDKELASLREQLKQGENTNKSLEESICNRLDELKAAQYQLKQKEDENRELKDDYKDLMDSIQRHFQTLIARNYNNIGVWSNERQDYNYQLISELEKLLKAHNNLSA